ISSLPNQHGVSRYPGYGGAPAGSARTFNRNRIRSMPDKRRRRVPPEKDEPVSGPGHDLEISRIPKVTLNHRDRVDLTGALPEECRRAPGKNRVVVIAPVMGQATAHQGSYDFGVPFRPETTLNEDRVARDRTSPNVLPCN